MNILTEENKASRHDCFIKILNTEWSLAERIVYIKLITLGNGDLDNLDISPTTITEIAEQLHLHRQTVSNAINALKTAGLINFEVKRTPLDQNGNPLKGRRFNKNIDTIKTDTYWDLLIPSDIPQQLQETKATEKRKAAAFKFRSDYKEIKAKLKEYEKLLTCPYCHQTGHVKIKISAICECEDCKKWIKGRQLDEMVEQIEGDTSKVIVSTQPPISVIRVVDEKIDTTSTVPLLSTEELKSDSPLFLLSEKIKDVNADITEGVESIKRFAEFFGPQPAYTICYPVDLLKDSHGKTPIGDNWTTNPRSLDEALKTTNNVGVLPEYSQCCFVDVDRHLEKFISKYPKLANYPFVFREDDLNRAKIIVPVTTTFPKFSVSDGIEFGLKVEMIGKGGHAVIAGIHESGSTIKILWGTSREPFTPEQLKKMAHDYIPTIEPKAAKKEIKLDKNTTMAEKLEAYARMFEDKIVAFVGGDIERFSIRPDDDTPSVIYSTKGFSRDTWRDFGDQTTHENYGKADSGGRIWDLFDLFVLWQAKGNLDNFKSIKRACVKQVKEYYGLDKK